MNKFWFLLLLWLYLGLFERVYTKNVSSRPAVVHVGSMLSPYSAVGKVAKIAIEEAMKDVNSDPNILHGTQLVLKEQSADCSGFQGMVEGMRFMETDIVAIIGPQCSVVAHVVCHVANELQVPLLAFSVKDPTLSRLQFPFFIRTTQSDTYQMAAVASVIDHFGWREVIAIFVDDDSGRNGVSALNDKLAEKRCRISWKAAIRPEALIENGEIMDILVKLALMQSRVIVLLVNPDLGFKIFSVAKYLEMMGNGYVWIATDWLSTYLDSYSPSSSEKMETMQGVIALRQHTPESNQKRDFYARWHKITGGSIGLNAYGLYAYDSVMLLARSLESFFSQGGKISFSKDKTLNSITRDSSLHLEAMTVFDQGNLLLKNILQTHIIGLTGQFKFTSDRSLFNPAYDILNVVGTGVRRIGFWSNHSGLSTVLPETLYSKPSNMSSESQRLYGVIWPGETMVKPRGWVFPNNGKLLRIGVPLRVSYHEFVSQIHGTHIFKGFCIDVFTAAVNLLPYAVPFQFVPYGDGKKNPTYTDMVKLITTGHFDGVVGDVAIVTNRTKTVDFTQPYIASGLVVVATFRKLNTGAWAFLRPFTPLMWTIIASFFLFIGIVVWFLEHRINDEFRGSPRQQCLTILWFSFSTMFFAQRENTVSTLGRVVLLIWLFVVLIINASYTASLTSILTVQKLSSPIKGIQSLKESHERIGYQVGSFAERYLREELGIPESRLVPLGSPEAFAKALKDGPDKGEGVMAIVDERPYVESFLSNNCAFRVVGQEFTKSGWGFAFPRDSPLAVDLSTAILELAENGDLQRIHDKWLKQNSCTLENTELESDRLHLKSFWGLFIVCGIACCISLLVYLVQILKKLYTATPNDSIADGQSSRVSLHSKRFQRFLSLMDERVDVSKRASKKRKIEKTGSEGHSSKRMEYRREESICSISSLE